MENIDTLIKDMLKIINALRKKKARIYDWSPEELLSAALELSALRTSAASIIAELDTEANFLELSAKEEEIKVYKKERDGGTSQKDSEMLAKKAVMELLKEASDKKGQMKQLKELVDKSGDFISMIQTRLKRAGEESNHISLENK